MRRTAVYLALGMSALAVQGSLAIVVSPPWCPDLGLLVVIALGLRSRGFGLGLCLVAALGLCADLLSGSLFGQHALLRLLVFTGAFLASRQLDLRGSLALAVFVFATCLLYGLGLFTLSRFFIGAFGHLLPALPGLVLHAGLNALVAPAMVALFMRAAVWAGERESGERTLRLDAHGRMA